MMVGDVNLSRSVFSSTSKILYHRDSLRRDQSRIMRYDKYQTLAASQVSVNVVIAYSSNMTTTTLSVIDNYFYLWFNVNTRTYKYNPVLPRRFLFSFIPFVRSC